MTGICNARTYIKKNRPQSNNQPSLVAIPTIRLINGFECWSTIMLYYQINQRLFMFRGRLREGHADYYVEVGSFWVQTWICGLGARTLPLRYAVSPLFKKWTKLGFFLIYFCPFLVQFRKKLVAYGISFQLGLPEFFLNIYLWCIVNTSRAVHIISTQCLCDII